MAKTRKKTAGRRTSKIAGRTIKEIQVELEAAKLATASSLRTWRLYRGLSINQTSRIVKQLGVSCDGSYLSRMERGTVNIPLRTVFALCKVLEIRPEIIVGGDVSLSPKIPALIPDKTMNGIRDLYMRDKTLLAEPLSGLIHALLASIK